MNLIEQALDEGQRRGWAPHALEDGHGRVCGLGALMAARGTLHDTSSLSRVDPWMDLDGRPETLVLAEELERAAVEALVSDNWVPNDLPVDRVVEAFNPLADAEHFDLIEEAFRRAAKRYDNEALGI